jgi:hypothetical protein
MKLVIKSDGTLGGTTATIDGKEIADLRDLFLSMWVPHDCSPQYMESNHISFNYSTRKKNQSGEMAVTTSFCFDPCKASIVESESPIDPREASETDYAKM